MIIRETRLPHTEIYAGSLYKSCIITAPMGWVAPLTAILDDCTVEYYDDLEPAD